jgi:hypothetical protein
MEYGFALSVILLVVSPWTALAENGTDRTQPPVTANVVDVRKIWDAGGHNAFTDLTRLGDRWFCVFREGAAHVSPDGVVRVLASDDGKQWRSAARIEWAGYDLRDPKIDVAADGKRLAIVGGATVREGNRPATESWSFVTFSTDGTTWDKPRRVGTKDRWLWRVTSLGGKTYGVDYDVRPDSRAARDYGTSLVASDDGISYKALTPRLSQTAGTTLAVGATEATLRFADDKTCYCLQRRDGKNNTALLGKSSPPYDKWDWKDLGTYFGGPNFIYVPLDADAKKGHWIAVGRMLEVNGQRGPKTVVCHLDATRGRLTPLAVLPSGGDTSYPGLAWHDHRLWISYYSSHEGKTSVYVANVQLRAVSGGLNR